MTVRLDPLLDRALVERLNEKMVEIAAAIQAAARPANTAMEAPTEEPAPTLPADVQKVLEDIKRSVKTEVSLLIRYRARLGRAIESIQSIQNEVVRSQGKMDGLARLIQETLDHYDPNVDNDGDEVGW